MTPQSPAPVAGRPLTAEADPIEPCGGCGETNPSRRCLGCLHDFVSRPASDQPVEAIGAGREDWLALVMLNVNRVYGDGLPPLRSLDETSLHYANEWREEARLALAGTSRFAALSPASPARTPMGGEVEALREAAKREEVARIVELAIVRHGVEETALEGTLRDADAILKALAASSPSPAQGGDTELKPDFLRSLPGGSLDDSTFQAIEDALDRAEAPCRADGDKGRWLTLPERIAALSASPQPEAGEAVALREAHTELVACSEYLEPLIDADGDSEGFYPNREMTLKSGVDRAIEMIEGRLAHPSVQPVEGK